MAQRRTAKTKQPKTQRQGKTAATRKGRSTEARARRNSARSQRSGATPTELLNAYKKIFASQTDGDAGPIGRIQAAARKYNKDYTPAYLDDALSEESGFSITLNEQQRETFYRLLVSDISFQSLKPWEGLEHLGW